MANRWWVPAAAAGAVVLVGAGTVLAVRAGGSAAPAPPAAAQPPAPDSSLDQLRVRDGDTVTASGTVLAAPGRPVRFCAPVAVAAIGRIGPEQPPDCSLGVNLTGADPARLTGTKTYQGTRWGQASITGRYAAGAITVATQGAPVDQPERPTGLPDGTPCPAPTGGWRPGPVDSEATGRLDTFVESRPAAYGEMVMTYPDGPPSGPTASPDYSNATQVLMVTTLLPAATAEKELRAHFAGNLCIRPAVRSRAAIDAVWNRINGPAAEAAWRQHGVFEGGPDYLAGRAHVSLVVLDDGAYGWLTGAAGGSPAIEADPWLHPAR